MTLREFFALCNGHRSYSGVADENSPASAPKRASLTDIQAWG